MKVDGFFATPVGGLLLLALFTVVPGSVGFLLGRRLVGRGVVVASAVALAPVVALASFKPVTTAFDHPQEDDDLGGVGYWVIWAWMLAWCAIGLLTGWLRARRQA